MDASAEEGDRRDGDVRPSPPPSARVRLEVDILSTEPAHPAPLADAAATPAARTVLVVCADADVRRWVHECLRALDGLRVLDAPRATDALALIARESPQLVVVDSSERGILAALLDARVILIAHDVRRADPLVREGRLAHLAPPFTVGQFAELARRMMT